MTAESALVVAYHLPNLPEMHARADNFRAQALTFQLRAIGEVPARELQTRCIPDKLNKPRVLFFLRGGVFTGGIIAMMLTFLSIY